MLYYIRDGLGFGQVKDYKTYFCYSVNKKEHLNVLLTLFAGNLLLQKTNQQFALWAESYALYYREPNPVLDWAHEPRTSPAVSFHNAWLSGFCDAEGCFDARWRNAQKQKLRFRFYVEQVDEPAMIGAIEALSKSQWRAPSPIP